MIRRVIILTKSSKYGGYCVAGIDIQNGNWIRLISDDDETHGALSDEDIQYENGEYCKPLDIVEVQIVRNTPSEYQPENMLIDSDEYWQKIGTATIDGVQIIHPAEEHEYILGFNEGPYITDRNIERVGHSLVLVEVDDLTLSHPEQDRRPKANFTYRGKTYENMSVTDEDFYDHPDRWHTNKAVLVMSLPDAPVHIDNGSDSGSDRYYKFVARIFPLE